MVEQEDKPTRKWSSGEQVVFWRDVVVETTSSGDSEKKQFRGEDFEGTHFMRKGDWEGVEALEIPGVDGRIDVTPVVKRVEGLSRRTFFIPENGVNPKDFPVEENPAPEKRARMIFKR